MVMALSEGTDGNRVAEARVTTSASSLRLFFQGTKPSFLISTSYIPGSRLMELSVAVFSSPLTSTCAVSGYDWATRIPEGVRVFFSKLGR